MSNLLRRPAGAAPLAVALLALLAACSGDALTPDAAVPIRAAASAPRLLQASGPSGLVSNAVRYRDRSLPHATGRSGSASLEGIAMLGADGLTRLTITTGSLDRPTRAPGEIVKAQIKAFDGSTQLFTQNYNRLTGGGTTTFILAGLNTASRIQVQANVRGIDRNRTDVVTLSETVKRAPRVVVDVHVPDHVQVSQPTVITGIVTEVNGDLGTSGDCQLLVNGDVVDQARDVWVDAGDAVTCAFTYTFPAPGTYTVAVRYNDVSASGVIGAAPVPVVDTDQVTVGGFLGGWSASAEDRTVTTTSTLDYPWSKPDGSHKEYENTEVNSVRQHTVDFHGSLGAPVAFPLSRVQLSLNSSGATWEDEDWSGLAATPNADGQPCANAQVSEQGALFWVCSTPEGGTFGFTRFGGTVTYHSWGFSHTFDALTGTPDNYSWNSGYTTSDGGGQTRPLGSALNLSLTITDALGATITVTPVVTLEPFSGTISETPRSCVPSSPYWLDGGVMNWCTGSSVTESGIRGTASN